MMRSLFAGVSGLQNHQTRMDVIGNNIANINTTGFKKGRVNFQDLLYQQLQGASRPTEDLGGVNPKEVGLGMSVATIDTIHTQGAFQSTGVGTDLAIQGTGFFVLKEGANSYYTRAGAFNVDEGGMLVNPANGMRVQGWMAQDVGGAQVLDVSRDVENLVIPVGSKDPARATTMVNFACNLDKRIPVIPEGATPLETQRGTWNASIKIYDSFGQEHILQVQFTRVPDTANSWNAVVTVDPEAEAATNAAIGLGDAAPAAGGAANFTINFSNNGTLLSALDGDGNASGNNPGAAVIMNVAYDVPNTDPDADGAQVRQEFSLNLGTVGGFVDSITQYAESSSSKAVRQDGYIMGYLDNFKIDASGTITGVYSNGSNRTIGQIAMASFTNPGGLEKAGDNAYVVSTNSGAANIGPSGIAGKGKIIAGTLEMSNVDMAEQFTDMIVTQRGFQANSRTIQTADQLLQELLSLKR
ncbi:MAG: flagellar hook protein FlgE [Spirochaetaceae bacterium]|jgi:flagellar hook protein FlgE|nr:flagellar hook protein FlgE [Spirochaetaceae bacterium]